MRAPFLTSALFPIHAWARAYAASLFNRDGGLLSVAKIDGFSYKDLRSTPAANGASQMYNPAANGNRTMTLTKGPAATEEDSSSSPYIELDDGYVTDETNTSQTALLFEPPPDYPRDAQLAQTIEGSVAIASKIWRMYEAIGMAALPSGSATENLSINMLMFECEHNTVMVVPTGNLLLFMLGKNTVDIGILRSKVYDSPVFI
ncbi:hypothetical protein EV182_003419 [Spiromyces aspiralis]|uniref:Uncharacterized protein n=1 Tax=Spiromyces aspiralis TaxID=68401 RepID=A0ACC1HEF8_9FUNG|nr:hypothetical protein EV182_003419 [Spiromyces aspiralis]